MVHVRFDGRSIDISDRELMLRAGMDDAEIKELVARRLDVGAERLNSYVIDRTATGNVIVRPEAVYG